MKFELSKTERKWIDILNVGGENNDFFYKFLSGDRYSSFNIESIDYDLNECFENEKMEKFIRSSSFVLECGSHLYLCKFENKYFVVDSKDGGDLYGCGNQIQNCINTILMCSSYVDIFLNDVSDDELEEYKEEYKETYGSEFLDDIEKYKELCQNIGLEYSDKQQYYQNEIDEFDELMRKLGIYE